MKIDFAREISIKILHDIEAKKAYSNIILDEYIKKNREKLSTKDISFISEIVYGTIMWKLTIDFIITKYSRIKISKISSWVLSILRMSIYQIIFLDKVPKSAAVNEGVNLTKKYVSKSSGFVNAILRKIDKKDYEEILNIKEDKKRISIMYSMPEWIIEKLLKQYEIDVVEQICKNSTKKPKTTIRINTLKITKEEFIKKLEDLKIEYEHTELENFLQLKIQNIGKLDLFEKGYFTVQDESAGLTSIVLMPKEGDIILDACSAPGGKTTHIAEIMNNNGKIIAWDIHEHRVKMVQDNAKRLGIDIINTQVNDASILKEELIQKFDKILLDVPCMGLGVIKRKPDIKWQKNKEDLEQVKEIQKNILNTCSKYLKKGGEIVYSTCSILRGENEEIIKEFIKNGDFEIKSRKNGFKEEYNILPTEQKDGFYICKLIKK